MFYMHNNCTVGSKGLLLVIVVKCVQIKREILKDRIRFENVAVFSFFLIKFKKNSTFICYNHITGIKFKLFYLEERATLL